MIVHARPAIVLAVLGAALSGCGNPWYPLGPGEAALYDHGWVRAEPRAPVAPVYCYATLARPDCHAEPRLDQPGRLIGYFGPRP